MRINKYNVEVDKDEKLYLVKESSCNIPELKRIENAELLSNVIKAMFKCDKLPQEHIYLVALNTVNKPIAFFDVSTGTVNNSICSNRDIFYRLLLCNAASFVLAHNHPSSCCNPSLEDVKFTGKVKEAGEMMGIPLLDHLIIGKNSYYSFKEHDRI